MLSIELLESWHISFGHSTTLDEVGLGRVACLGASQNWKIRRLLDLQIVVGLKIVDWRIRRREDRRALALATGGSEGGSENRGQFVRLLL